LARKRKKSHPSDVLTHHKGPGKGVHGEWGGKKGLFIETSIGNGLPWSMEGEDTPHTQEGERKKEKAARGTRTWLGHYYREEEGGKRKYSSKSGSKKKKKQLLLSKI